MSEEKQQFHYFTSSILYWRTNECLLKCIDQQKKADRDKTQSYQAIGFAIYRVPLPADADYVIKEYRPMVDGTSFVGRYDYDTHEFKSGDATVVDGKLIHNRYLSLAERLSLGVITEQDVKDAQEFEDENTSV